MQAQPFVISYARYSSMAQREGTSLERQAEYAQRWADEHGMTLDRTLRDQGVSAFKGRHAQKGELGGFLRDVEAGKVPRGSVLVVESLDRLSREKALKAMGQFAQIIDKGITIVTAKDRMVYNERTIRENSGNLFMSLGVMIRSNEESETKATRGRDAIRLRCKAWLAGDRSHRNIRGGFPPAWLRRAGDGFELDPECAHATRVAVDLYLAGHGMIGVSKVLTERGLKLTPRGSHVAQVERLLRNPALIGQSVVEVREPERPVERYVLDGYYPPLLKLAEWHALQDAIAARAAPTYSNKGTIPHVLTGFGATVCGYCGSAITSQIYTRSKRDERGLIPLGHRRLRCSARMNAAIQCKVPGHSVAAEPMERAVMEFCSDLMNLRGLHGGEGDAAARAALDAAKEREAKLAEQLNKLTDLLLASEDSKLLPTFAKRALALEADKLAAQAAVDAAQRALARASRADLNGVEAKFRKLTKGVLAQEPDARRQARQLVIDTFDQIVLFSRGIRPSETPEGVTHLVLRARGGVERILQIDAAGAWDALSETYRPAGKPGGKSTSKSSSANSKGRRKAMPA